MTWLATIAAAVAGFVAARFVSALFGLEPLARDAAQSVRETLALPAYVGQSNGGVA